jgi:sugar phosphate isomerase/epimerase
MNKLKIGVSPAYHISRYGDRFTPEDVAESLPDIVAMGFTSFQLEVFHPDMLSAWLRQGSRLVAKAAERHNIFPSQFAGHFLLHGFGSSGELNSDFGIEEIKACLDILKPFPGCSVITLVVPAFLNFGSVVKRSLYRQLIDRFINKLKTILNITEDGDKKLALEILPGSFIGGLQGLLHLIDTFDSPNFGYNFDTGHAWVCREAIELVPAMLADRIFGTHLKDNDQKVNLSLVPGTGTIPWNPLIRNLMDNGYKGYWDLEIQCKRDKVQSEYAKGLIFIESILNVFKEENHG